MPPAPVKEMFGEEAFWQTEVVPLMPAVGNGFTITVALPDCACEQVVELASCTLTNVYTKLPAEPVGTETVTELPDEVVTV